MISLREFLQKSHDIHELRDSTACEKARVKYMLSKAMDAATEPQDIRKRERLLEEAVRIKSDLRKSSQLEEANEVIFDSLVEGQLR